MLYTSDWSHEFDDHSAGLVPAHRLFGAAELPGLGHAVERCGWGPIPERLRRAVVWKVWQALWVMRIQRRADCLIAATEGSALAVLLLKRVGLLRRPVIVISVAVLADKYLRGVRGWLRRWLIRGASFVVVLASGQVPLVSSHLRIPEGRIRFIPFGVDTGFFSPLSTAVLWDVVSVGTNEGKDFPTLLAALSPSMRCLIVTDDQNRQLIRSTTTAATVEVDHDIPITRLRTLYASGSHHVIPLRDVPFSSGQTVLLENLAMGNAVIVSDTVATRDYVSPEVATIVPPGDVPAMREALSALPSGSVAAAVQHVRRHFTSQRFAVDLAALCSEISEGERHHGWEPVRPTSKASAASQRRHKQATPATQGSEPELVELVVCSLEPWDEIWRRNQFLVHELLRRSSRLRVLFVEPPERTSMRLRSLGRPSPHRQSDSYEGRLLTFRPLLAIPRRAGQLADEALVRQVSHAARAAGFKWPALWINDVTYARLIGRSGWPSLYDITDDWLLAPFPRREIERLRKLEAIALAHADEVVVCSAALEESRGRARPVTVIPNGVDVAHFRRPQPRPSDMPSAPTAVYVGSLHDARLDVELVVDLADALPRLNVILVGPDSLSEASRGALDSRANAHLLGARPYAVVPGYLQHADVVVVPHRVSPFTESLDPIKAYECLAAGRPTVATPVAGFRDHEKCFSVVARDNFIERVRDALASGTSTCPGLEHVSWAERAEALDQLLRKAIGGRRPNL
jgi:glycosyltransferase involved in cell wall biosynthesis